MILMMFVIIKFLDEQKIVSLQKIALRKRIAQHRAMLKEKRAQLR
jgi:hypothetical protein